MDPSTAAAIAAVAIAVLAFVVAFAQVLQQYFVTGSLLRLCDSVVYGPLPGRGRRVWQPGQFRFRVIYTLPQLRLEKGLWGEEGDDDVHLHEYPYIEEWSDRKFSPQSSIGHRCPSDLPNVPMQISLRDIVILGLQTGMKITSPYIDIETGVLLHFAPSGLDAGHGSLVNRDQRKINKLWVLRANNYAIVAGRAYNYRERLHLLEQDGEWLPAAQMEGFEPDERRHRRGVQRYTQDDPNDRKTTHSESKGRRPKNKQSENTQPTSWKLFTDKSEDIDHHNENTTHDVRALLVNEPSELISQPSTVPLTEVEDEISSHHASRSDDSLANGDESMLSEGTGIAPDSGSESNDDRQDKTDPTQVGDPVSVAYQGPSHASKENFELAIVKSPETSRFNAKKPDENREKRGQGESLPSSSSSNATTTPPVRTGDREKVPSEDHDRQDSGHTSDEDTGSVGPKLKRAGQREAPPQRRRRDWKRTYYFPDHEYNQLEHYRGRIQPLRTFWQWFSQMDIMHGYWATPWQTCVVAETIEGALSAILAALSARLNKRNLQYIPPNGEVKEVLEWASGGRSTWPMYAMNARGGVIVQENKTKFKFPGFSSKIAAVKLLHDHRWQVEKYTESSQADEKLAELMMLDSWLSDCGQEPEILNGASDLRDNMPLLIKFIFEKFEERFDTLDRTADEGALQHIQSVARSLSTTLDDERLSAAEQIFTIVAMLRTAKVASCISAGPETCDIIYAFDTDTRVWLV
ncbi:MAG: hypothetical protein Q9192_005089 [Flavoplaca navasiana]